MTSASWGRAGMWALEGTCCPQPRPPKAGIRSAPEAISHGAAPPLRWPWPNARVRAAASHPIMLRPWSTVRTSTRRIGAYASDALGGGRRGGDGRGGECLGLGAPVWIRQTSFREPRVRSSVIAAICLCLDQVSIKKKELELRRSISEELIYVAE